MAPQTIEPVTGKKDTEQCAPAKLPGTTTRQKLTPHELAILHRLLTEPTAFVDHPALYERGADVRLFGVAAKLTGPDATRFPKPVPIGVKKPSSGARVPTLKIEEEQCLFLRINYARKQILDILNRYAGKRLSFKAARTLIAWGRWEQEVRARIVELNIPLVLAMAKRTRLTGVDFNEMRSEEHTSELQSH